MEFRKAFDPFRALQGSWKLLTRAPVTLLLGAILIAFLDSGGPTSWGYQFDEDSLDELALIVLPLACFGLLLALALFVFSCKLHVGYAGALQRVMVTGEERFSDLFNDRGLWITMVLARVLKYVLVLFTFLPALVMFVLPLAVVDLADGPHEVGLALGSLLALAFLPIWIYVLLGLVLVEQVVAVESRGATEAIKRSWEVARGNRLTLLAFSIVIGFFQALGLCLCGCGVYLTSALGYGGWYEAYLRFATKPPEGGMWVDGTRTEPADPADGGPASPEAEDMDRPPDPRDPGPGEPGVV